MSEKVLQVLSLGAGVQSSTLFLMSCLGELPRLDCAIFADTQWEPRTVYDHLAFLEMMSEKHGIPIHRVSKGNLREHTMQGFVRGSKKKGKRYASLPLRVLNDDGTSGMIRRQCTKEYKIEPIEKFVKAELLGIKKGCRWPKEHAIDQWQGITSDEAQRMRTSHRKAVRFVYPFCNVPQVDYLDRTWSRQACVAWLGKNFPKITIPKSSCIGCPFHDNAMWREIRRNPKEWADACEVDEAIRHADGMNGQVFLHRDCVPLKQANIDKDENQSTFGWDEECTGYCGT